MTQDVLTDRYIQRTGWTIEDYIKHDQNLVDSFVKKVSREELDRRILAWQEAQSNSKGYRPSEEDFIIDLQEMLIG